MFVRVSVTVSVIAMRVTVIVVMRMRMAVRVIIQALCIFTHASRVASGPPGVNGCVISLRHCGPNSGTSVAASVLGCAKWAQSQAPYQGGPPMNPPRLRQLVIAANSLETADQLREVLGLGEPFPDPGVGEFGLVNAVFALGDQFLEVVVPTQDSAPARRFIDRGGEGGYMVIVQTDDLAALRDRVDGLGVRRVWNIDLPDISASHLHPADIGGAIVSVDEPRPAGSWRWGGPGWRERAAPGKFTGAVLEAPDPEALAQKWGLILGVTPDRGRLFLADAVLEFRKGPAVRLAEFGFDLPDTDKALERASGLGLEVDGASVDVSGVRLNLGA